MFLALVYTYSQWQTTDRVSLATVTSAFEEYKNTLISNKNNNTLIINAITKHSFLAKCQANFLRAKKESLKVTKVIVLGDFAENYQFLGQDELHPLVVYFIDGDGNIHHNSLYFISDDSNHDTNFAYKIQTTLVDHL